MEQVTCIPDIDERETWERVEKALKQCNEFERMGYKPKIRSEAKTTPGYSIIPPSNTNAFHSTTEDTAQKNVDYELNRINHVHRVRSAVSKLSSKERQLIEKRYLQDPDVFDWEVYGDMHISERTYYRIKNRAFYILAFALRLEVMK